jgi:hypothetical protein
MKRCNKTLKCKKCHKSKDEWDPLLLILPLRLGLNEFNEEYKDSIKVRFLTISFLFIYLIIFLSVVLS